MSANPIQSAFAPQTKDVDQRIYTPVILIERVLLKVWPEGIAYDPFPGDMAPVSNLADRCAKRDGYAEPLVDRSYGNCPFNRLKEAMIKFRAAAREPWCSAGIMLLGPAQTHRKWFWPNRGHVVAWLKPLKFHGFEHTYPKPLCLHYWGHRDAAFRDAIEASELAVHVDDCDCAADPEATDAR